MEFRIEMDKYIFVVYTLIDIKIPYYGPRTQTPIYKVPRGYGLQLTSPQYILLVVSVKGGFMGHPSGDITKSQQMCHDNDTPPPSRSNLVALHRQ
jgi:hypothetical protein